MNKDNLLELSKNLDTEYEIGIWSETRDLLERQDNITDFSIKYAEGQYNIIIKLQDLNLHAAKTLFTLLVQFIEYDSTFYVREDKKDSFVYYLLSSMDSKKAFLCYIVIQ